MAGVDMVHNAFYPDRHSSSEGDQMIAFFYYLVNSVLLRFRGWEFSKLHVDSHCKTTSLVVCVVQAIASKDAAGMGWVAVIGKGTSGHGFFIASDNFTKHPSGPAMLPMVHIRKDPPCVSSIRTYH